MHMLHLTVTIFGMAAALFCYFLLKSQDLKNFLDANFKPLTHLLYTGIASQTIQSIHSDIQCIKLNSFHFVLMTYTSSAFQARTQESVC